MATDMSYIKPLVERYRVTRFAHIERRQDALNQECNVINDVTGKSHSTHATMEDAKYSLSRLELKLRPPVWRKSLRSLKQMRNSLKKD